ncbi:CDR ABC transporter [Penicillium expansum]|uniref:CDR ABC transporter n=1 Tax=Penicillium expansum TaxID=27334 RepID=A0A0A2KAH3_PENEN|nr:CDR ABC transporter [Penicillium expansum]KGO49411.1 CDR ABC transporter [Penicillium expansum]KGO63886.1 CDR ABC transporter [Penicillium expansum]
MEEEPVSHSTEKVAYPRKAESHETLSDLLHGTQFPPEIPVKWGLSGEVSAMQERDLAAGYSKRELGVTWKNLTVDVLSAGASVNENFFSQFNLLQLARDLRQKPAVRSILQDSHGCVKPGEMLLVLGRPGSGCTTLLNVLSNRRAGYRSVSGDVKFGSMTPEEAEQYKGQIVMNSEEEVFFPTLTVGQTMDFATRLKIPFHIPDGVTPADWAGDFKRFLMESMKISHTEETKVGNEFVRGVSGGERKRVSIIECMATRGSVFCWDNSTRGLDASTALEWAKALRAMTDILGLTTIVTLYQAGNGIYDLFDKVLVLDEGQQIFYGPAPLAKPFMEGLGFGYTDGANVSDYLTGITVPTERSILPGYEGSFPQNPDELLGIYQKSDICQNAMLEYDYASTPLAQERTSAFQDSVAFEKNTSLPKGSPLTTAFHHQLKICIIRQYQIIWGEKSTFLIRQFVSLAMALIVGSCFYDSPDTSAGLFTKGGAVFFSHVYQVTMAMAEVTGAFRGRPILIKHKSFGYHHPAAYAIAILTAELPVVLFQCTIFSVVLYWMVGLKATAAAFFTFWIILIAITLCVNAMFRSIGAACSNLEVASKVSGIVMKFLVMYTGYMIPKPQIKNWFVELYYANPMAYAFQAGLTNEFHDKTLPCVGGSLIPHGAGYNDSNYQSCAGVAGAERGATYVTGDNYLAALHWKHSQLWRNFGVVWGWWTFFVAIAVVSTCMWRAGGAGSNSLLIPREKMKHFQRPRDEETQSPGNKESQSNNPITADDSQNETRLMRNTSVFTWKNLVYTVQTPSGDRVLLDNIYGWVKPGMLGALMGSSGAGKTTLLDVLAQRKTEGTIRGTILVDGRELPVSFQRMAGYCEQLDVHEGFATVREALEFSALLRQPEHVPKEEKLAYVDTIIDLLELHDLADTLIGSVGEGLSVEQRKRVTIGVELVSKPSILIFLDEPTSGLDGQSAYNTVRFLRRLADAGQAILVTIHQPSAQLFAQFDTLLLLAKGGKMVYFGDIGDKACTVSNYFANYGAPCPVSSNPAEHMIDVVTGGIEAVKDKDWHQVWLDSPENAAAVAELDQIVAEASAKPPATVDDGKEFATSLWTQTKLVTARMSVSLARNTKYVNNKLELHIISALLNGFSFWHLGPSVSALQLKMFTIFNFTFVAPGVINQLQPLFIQRRDIYDAREKKSRMYSWKAFVTGLIVSEFPYLCLCAVSYFVCWYYQTNLPRDSKNVGATFFIMLIYEFIYTGIGQFVAAYAPNATFAALVNPLIVNSLVLFCGAFVPQPQLNVFWKFWFYYLNPFNYVVAGMFTFGIWDATVTCNAEEFAYFDPPNGTCKDYLADYMAGVGSAINLINPEATSQCQVCQYTRGSDYLKNLNINHYYYGWRDAGICVIFAISGYALVFGLMKLRTKASKKAE